METTHTTKEAKTMAPKPSGPVVAYGQDTIMRPLLKRLERAYGTIGNRNVMYRLSPQVNVQGHGEITIEMPLKVGIFEYAKIKAFCDGYKAAQYDF